MRHGPALTIGRKLFCRTWRQLFIEGGRTLYPGFENGRLRSQ
jgi:hypothetical protein